MKLCDLLHITPGVTAIIGSGGKTGLITQLAGELKERGKVVICTTTKMWAPAPGEIRCELREEAELALQAADIVYVGPVNGQNKLIPPAFDGWQTLADYVLVEADGAAGLPLKAHAPWEPVLPEGRTQTICVVGASGIGKPLALVAHRPEQFAALCGKSVTDTVWEEDIAAVLNGEGFHDRVFINQTDLADAADLARRLRCAVVTGSLKAGTWEAFP